jgi:mRNA interferase RelE/StbE
VKVAFKESFRRDLRVIRDKSLLERVRGVIEAVETADSLALLPNLKLLKGSRNYFRVRIGDYRIGLSIQEDTVIFVRFLNRKDIYRYFP